MQLEHNHRPPQPTFLGLPRKDGRIAEANKLKPIIKDASALTSVDGSGRGKRKGKGKAMLREFVDTDASDGETEPETELVSTADMHRFMQVADALRVHRMRKSRRPRPQKSGASR